jgi:hypothetical protein
METNTMKDKTFKSRLEELLELYPAATTDLEFNGYENDLQSKCFQWAWNFYPEYRRLLFCVNNNSENAIKGSMNRALGVVEGVSDMVQIYYKGVAFLEFKRATGRQRDKQKDFEAKCKMTGHLYILIRSFEAFQYVYLTLLSVSKDNPLKLKNEQVRDIG